MTPTPEPADAPDTVTPAGATHPVTPTPKSSRRPLTFLVVGVLFFGVMLAYFLNGLKELKLKGDPQ